MKNDPNKPDEKDSIPDECTHPNRVMLWALEPDKKRILIYRPGCGLWTCPGCRKRLQRYWILRVGRGVQEYAKDGGLFQFVTVTSHEKLKTMQATVGIWPKAWSKLYNRIKYNTAGKVHYVLVPELHKNGRLHAHLIVESQAPQRWWKDAARKSGLGFMAEAEKLEGEWAAAWYVSKYLGKDLGDFDWPKGFRRIRTSQAWPELEKMKGGDLMEFKAVTSKAAQRYSIRHWFNNNFEVYDLTDGRWLHYEGEFVDTLGIWD